MKNIFGKIRLGKMLAFREIKWAWQRVYRGWDDSALWNLDTWLAKIIVETVSEFKKNHHGLPTLMFQEGEINPENGHVEKDVEERRLGEYNEILSQIVEGFSVYLDADYCPMTVEQNTKLKKSFDLLHTYFGTLWD